jgi:hypothetical protein
MDGILGLVSLYQTSRLRAAALAHHSHHSPRHDPVTYPLRHFISNPFNTFQILPWPTLSTPMTSPILRGRTVSRRRTSPTLLLTPNLVDHPLVLFQVLYFSMGNGH